MFETFAVLSTLSCIVIFVVLFQIDRAGRREEAATKDDSTAQGL
jgi:hypothetical protein